MTAAPEGLLLIDKPVGPTSHDVIARVRRILGVRRVGHAGTLDPPASGLLPVMIGRATRLIRFLPHAPKTYEGRLELGRTTDTEDATGRTVSRSETPPPPHDVVAEAASRLVGRHDQVPPMVSARKVEGRRLYELARKGLSVERRATPVQVDRFDVSADGHFLAVVSAGTYIRSLVRDLGEALGCGGVLTELRRTAIGPLRVGDAVGLDLDAGALAAAVTPVDRVPLTPPAIARDGERCTRFVNGISLDPPTEIACAEGSFVRVVDEAGRLVGVAEVRDGRLQPRVVLERTAGA